MQNFPHHYTVTAVGSHGEEVELQSEGLPPLRTATPPEFDGPGGRWSPETLLVGAIGDCLALTFRGVARRSGLTWTSFECDVTGTLDRPDQSTRFVEFDIHARIQLPAGGNSDLARRVLEKAERTCLITNSLNGSVRVVPSIEVAASVPSIDVSARVEEPAAV
jgi:organic hydroperoxide reductase OsmC/OhrA